jgi:MSHA biogenesis protein MshJ
MKRVPALLQRQARRIDALSLRERAIMFLSVSVALVAAFDHLVLSPRMAEQKAVADQMRQDTRELEGLRAQLAPAPADGPGGARARELAEWQAQRQRLDEELAQLHAVPQGNAALPELLERVLRRHERLTLVRLATAKESADNAVAKTERPALDADTRRQAVQITMRGSYPELTQYLADTEAALPGVRWGEVAITRQGSSAELTATVWLHRSPT